jgi:transcriptional adapter 2-alpha
MKDGLGNWADAATHIGTRTKEDCERHYLEVYLGVGPNGEDLDQSMDVEETGSEPPRKKQKREFMPVSTIWVGREV